VAVWGGLRHRKTTASFLSLRFCPMSTPYTLLDGLSPLIVRLANNQLPYNPSLRVIPTIPAPARIPLGSGGKVTLLLDQH
jgi:hypothetical protein